MAINECDMCNLFDSFSNRMNVLSFSNLNAEWDITFAWDLGLQPTFHLKRRCYKSLEANRPLIRT